MSDQRGRAKVRVAGGILLIFMAIVLAYSVFCRVRGVFDASELEAALKRQQAMAAWPKAAGKVTAIEIIADTMRFETYPTSYHPSVLYTFEVNGKQLKGKYALPMYSRFAEVEAKLAALGIALPEQRQEESIETFGFDRKYTYQASQALPVYFDAQDPSNSTLLIQAPPSWWQFQADNLIILVLQVLAILVLLTGCAAAFELRVMSRIFPGAVAFGSLGLLFLSAGGFIFWNDFYAAEFPNFAVSIIALVISSVFVLGGICLLRLAFK